MLVRVAFSTTPPGVPGTFTLRWFQEAYTEPGLGRVAYNTFFYSTVKLAVAAFLGGSLGFLVARTDIPFRRTFEFLAPVPFFVPGILTALAWAMLANPDNGVINTWLMNTFGLDGPVFNVYSMTGMIFHGAQGTSALFFLLTIGAFKTLNSEMEEAGRVCGAKRNRVVTGLVVPVMIPALSGALILNFIRGLESFETPLFLGRPAGIYLFSTEIYRYLRFRSPVQHGTATALGLGVVLLTFVLIYFQWRLIGKRSYVTLGGKGGSSRPMRLGAWRWGAFSLVSLYFAISVFIPVGFLLASSFTKLFGRFGTNAYTLDNWRTVLDAPFIRSAYANTLVVALAAGAVTVLLALMISYVKTRSDWWGGKALDLLTWIPWALPGLILGLAFLWASIFLPGPINIYGTLTLLTIAYVINGLPLAARVMGGTVVQIGPDLEDMARICGASWIQSVRDVLVRLLRVGFVSAWALVAYGIIGNLTLPVLLSAPGTEVLSIALLRLWSDGTSSLVSVVAILLLLTVLILTFIEQRTRRRGTPSSSVK